MTNGKMDLNDLLNAIGPFGWKRSIVPTTLHRPVRDASGLERGVETIMPDGPGRPGQFIYQGSWVGIPYRSGRPDEKAGTVEEVLAHLISKYAQQAKEAA